MSRQLEDLVPEVRKMAEQLVTLALSELGVRLLVTQTYRRPEEQAALYAQGRTAAGKIVTHAPPGYSWHEFGRAFDVCFLKGSKAVYAGPWEEVGAIGERLGLEWGGRWKHEDRPHFQWTGGMTLAQARIKGYKEHRSDVLIAKDLTA